MATLPIVLGVVAVAAVPAAAFVMLNEYHDLMDDGCALTQTVALAPDEGRLVQVRIRNVGEAASLRACVYEADAGPERYEGEIELSAGTDHVIRVRVSDDAGKLVLELDRPGYDLTGPVYAIIASSSRLPACEEGIPEVVFETDFYDNASGIAAKPPVCVRP